MAAGKRISKTQALKAQLRDILVHLQQVQSAVVVAVAALRQQACELDEDIAAVLQRSVADRLQDQMDKLEAALQLCSQLERKR
jgi:hypothetical protein